MYVRAYVYVCGYIFIMNIYFYNYLLSCFSEVDYTGMSTLSNGSDDVVLRTDHIGLVAKLCDCSGVPPHVLIVMR